MTRRGQACTLIGLGGALVLIAAYSLYAPGSNPSSITAVQGETLAAAPGNDGEGLRPDPWESPGTQWRLKVRQYNQVGALVSSDSALRAQGRIPRIEHEGEMLVEVLEPRALAGRKTGRLRMTPVAKLPEPYAIQVARAYVLELDLATGEPQGIVPSPLMSNTGISTFEKITFLTSDLWFYPVNWIAENAERRRMPEKKTQRVVYLDKGKHYKVVKTVEPTEISLRSQGGEIKKRAVRIELAQFSFDKIHERIVQTWIPGEGWWRTFQRFDGEPINLEAELIER